MRVESSRVSGLGIGSALALAPFALGGCDEAALGLGWALSLGASIAMFWGAVRLDLPRRAGRAVKAKVGRGRS